MLRELSGSCSLYGGGSTSCPPALAEFRSASSVAERPLGTLSENTAPAAGPPRLPASSVDDDNNNNNNNSNNDNYSDDDVDDDDDDDGDDDDDDH